MDKKKLQNFWYYNKTYILVGIAVAAFLLWNFLPSSKEEDKFDYGIAIVCPEYFDDSMIETLESSLEQVYGRTKVRCYHIEPGADVIQSDVEASYLDMDLVSRTSGAFLVRDPEKFREAVSVELSDPVPVSGIDYLAGLGFDSFYLVTRADY